MNEKQLNQYMENVPRGRTHFASVEIRSWWNPLRYILGKFYYKKL
jgi:hypothetical protein